MAKQPYLLEILNYFQDRKAIYLIDDGEKEYLVTAGVPQCSVLELQLPNGSTIVGFAYDIAIVSVAKHGLMRQV